MDDVFEIKGIQIPFSSIKEYRIVTREYIYRPTYKEIPGGFFSGPKYAFKTMEPYAAIIDESEKTSALNSYKAKNFGESLGKDLADFASGVVSTIGDKLNIKAFKYKKFLCINAAGRIFTTYIEDIPTVLRRSDGKVSDVYKNDKLYALLGEPIAPTIKMIPALFIKAKETHTFYGNGIQIDVDEEYERLKTSLNKYKEEKANKKKITLPKVELPPININLPSIGKPKTQQIPAKAKKQAYIDADYVEIIEQEELSNEIEYDPLDLNRDGVVDEKDLYIFQQKMKEIQNKDTDNK